MIRLLDLRKAGYWSLIILSMICILFMFAEIINHRFWLSDFEVYYKAAGRILHSQNLYRISDDGHYVFKYSPTSAVYFIPFSFLPFALAKYAYWLLLTAIIVYGFYHCVNIIKPVLFDQQYRKRLNIIFCLATLIMAIHFLRELHLGQVNFVLLFLFLSAIYSFDKGKRILFSFLLAMSFFLKPFALIFVPFLLIKKRFTELVLLVIFCFLLFLLPFLFYDSIDTTIGQYQYWIDELSIELSHKQGLLEDANHTLFSVIARYSPIRFLLTNETIVWLYQSSLLISLGFAFLWFTKINSKNISASEQRYFSIVEMSLLIALIPLLAFTSENAFIFNLILVFIILIHFHNLKNYEKALSIIGFIFIGGNFGELLGKSLSRRIDELSLISIGSLILIYLLFILRRRNLLREKPGGISAY